MQGVDCHAHVFSATAPPVAGARYRPSYAARLAAWRALWRPAGITHGVLIQPSFFGTNNTEMLATIAPTRRAARRRGRRSGQCRGSSPGSMRAACARSG
jgi:predicted TIM-barrel fold metal-dependent hydrolase